MNLLDLICKNETDASETLAPPGIGSNITDPQEVRQVFSGKVAMIYGIGQFNILTDGATDDIRKEVHRLFKRYGKDGGYILSASDHFFETPVENLKTLAEAAKQCTY